MNCDVKLISHFVSNARYMFMNFVRRQEISVKHKLTNTFKLVPAYVLFVEYISQANDVIICREDSKWSDEITPAQRQNEIRPPSYID